MSTTSAGTNWAGNVTYRARTLHHPTTTDEVRRIVTGARRVRALGSRHSFTPIADSEQLISLDGLPGEISVDATAGEVTVPAGTTYAELAAALAPRRLALPNLASLPHISVAGAVATGTHGSGTRLGSLGTAVRGLELVTGDGELHQVRRGEPDFDGLVVGLGALGIVTAVTLAVMPSYEVAQRVYTDLPWDVVLGQFDELMASGDSVSVFHRAGERTEQLWVKRLQPGEPYPDELYGARAALVARNPVPGADAANATEQLGVAGPWSERLPHFRSGFTPSSGEEIQSELLVGREHAAAAIEAMLGLGALITPLLFVAELRTIAADDLWLSPMYGRDTLGLHFTWHRQPDAVAHAVAALEQALAPFAARPHWGKVTEMDAAALAPLYPRWDDFLALRERLDPRDVFVNDWLIEHVLGRD
ncbi:MAG TPA: D-arabinono-1,4-lactone oxidase [Solirubrobacteraceae bacterium]|nr:D-arabinono-1,4-lactone oxidase [Solirubrobacteraceae bacterium]